MLSLVLALLLQVIPGSPFGGGGAGSSALASRTVTGNATVTSADDVIFVNVSAADVPVISLPAASSRTKPLYVWCIGPAAVKINPNGSDNINGGNFGEYISTFATARVYYSDGASWWSQAIPFQTLTDVKKGGYLYEDFQVAQGTLAATNGLVGSTNLEGVMSGTVTSITAGGVASIATMNTGNTATGRVSIHSGIGVGLMGTAGFYTLQMGVQTDANLSTAGETYALYLGFGDNDGAGDMTDGVYFGYIHSVASGAWTCNSSAAGVHTNGCTGGTPTTVVGATYYKMRITVDNRTGTPVAYFWVNDSYLGQTTTNIPTTGANAFAHFLTKIEKAVGTTARTFIIDYFLYNSTVVNAGR